MLRKLIIGGCFSLFSLGLVFTTAAQGEQANRIEIRQWATSATASSQFGDSSWSAMQATGSPDTFTCRDAGSAWASASSTESATLTVMFDIPIVPSQVIIHQTYNPGAITGIELLPADGSGAIVVTNSGDPGGSPCPGVLTIDILSEVVPVNGVTISLDQRQTGNWNEIDAVELVGLAELGSEISMWADYAEATSQYGSDGWSASQAIGQPDTPDCGDATTAWASADITDDEQLFVFFPYLVIPTRLDIYQSYNPGAITSVELIRSDGKLVPVTNSADPGVPCPGYMSLSIETNFIAMGAVIHLDQTITGDWNEIDAVQMTGLLADDGLIRQWAFDATATSAYGDDNWSALQATGAPNSRGCGDHTTAWASATSTGQDTLTVYFEQAVIPTSIYIYQTYNPGAITGIQVIPADGSAPIDITGFDSDIFITCPGILVIDIVDRTPAVNGVTIILDQTRTGSWNEIDAVRLIGKRVNTK